MPFLFEVFGECLMRNCWESPPKDVSWEVSKVNSNKQHCYRQNYGNYKIQGVRWNRSQGTANQGGVIFSNAFILIAHLSGLSWSDFPPAWEISKHKIRQNAYSSTPVGWKIRLNWKFWHQKTFICRTNTKKEQNSNIHMHIRRQGLRRLRCRQLQSNCTMQTNSGKCECNVVW